MTEKKFNTNLMDALLAAIDEYDPEGQIIQTVVQTISKQIGICPKGLIADPEAKASIEENYTMEFHKIACKADELDRVTSMTSEEFISYAFAQSGTANEEETQ